VEDIMSAPQESPRGYRIEYTCTGRRTHPKARMVTVRPKEAERLNELDFDEYKDALDQAPGDPMLSMPQNPWPRRAEYRCPECDRTVRLGGRKARLLRYAGELVHEMGGTEIDLSLLPF
jgi:hypothetical protein